MVPPADIEAVLLLPIAPTDEMSEPNREDDVVIAVVVVVVPDVVVVDARLMIVAAVVRNGLLRDRLV